MKDLPNTLDVAQAITMPFFPMRPANGSPLRTPNQVKRLIDELGDEDWLYQPKLGGVRACLAVVDKHVWIQNRHGQWLTKAPTNYHDFLKLPDRTCFDGEILNSEFHPFECLAVRGQSLIFKPTVERATVALQMVKFLGHAWLFREPTPRFLRAQRKNLPLWEGVVMKRYMAFYVMLSKDTQSSNDWLKRKW